MGELQRERLTVDISPVRGDEIEALSELATRTWAASYGPYMTPEALKQALQANQSVEYFTNLDYVRNRILVARHRGNVVGYVQFGGIKINAPDPGPDDKELTRLYVDEKMRGRGIGHQLLDEAFNDPLLKDAPTVFVEVWEEKPVAIDLYRRYGFNKIASREFTLVDGSHSRNFIMARPRSHTS